MAFPQITYTNGIPQGGLAGQIVDMRPSDKISRTLDVSVPFGVFVAKGARARPAVGLDCGSCKLPTLTGDQILGVVIYEHHKGSRDLAGALAVAPPDVVSIMREGVIYALAEKAVTEGGPVFVRHAASGGNTQLGAATDTDDGANTSLLAGARWAATTTAAGPAPLELKGSINAMT